VFDQISRLLKDMPAHYQINHLDMYLIEEGNADQIDVDTWKQCEYGLP